MVRRSVLVQTDTGMVDPSDVCSKAQQSRPSLMQVAPSDSDHDPLHAGYTQEDESAPRAQRLHATAIGSMSNLMVAGWQSPSLPWCLPLCGSCNF